jgi:hypothetical protein
MDAEKNEEIKITPEMTQAGVSALASYDFEFESREDAARRIFREMHKAVPKLRKQS